MAGDQFGCHRSDQIAATLLAHVHDHRWSDGCARVPDPQRTAAGSSPPSLLHTARYCRAGQILLHNGRPVGCVHALCRYQTRPRPTGGTVQVEALERGALERVNSGAHIAIQELQQQLHQANHLLVERQGQWEHSSAERGARILTLERKLAHVRPRPPASILFRAPGMPCRP